jgi:chromosome segregation ATPase
MWPFKRKNNDESSAMIPQSDGTPSVLFDPSVLKQNNITRLSIDERWTKLFVKIKRSPEIEKAEMEMNELIKKEAMLKNEQENLEPTKRRCMNEIISLTKEAFESNNEEAKQRLKVCKKEIEKINARMEHILEDIEKLDDTLKAANQKLLEDSTAYIFSTLKAYKDRTSEILAELAELEQRQKALREELEGLSVDWTQYATDLTELIGTNEVKRLEKEFGLEDWEHETADTPTDEDH